MEQYETLTPAQQEIFRDTYGENAVPNSIRNRNRNRNRNSDSFKIKISPDGILTVYFFIGRLNPPHAGHEAALRELIRLAENDDTQALILLGEGPFGGTKTLDNPLSFELKELILKHKLADLNKDVYVIKKKTDKPVDDLFDFTTKLCDMKKTPGSPEISSIIFKLLTGIRMKILLNYHGYMMHL